MQLVCNPTGWRWLTCSSYWLNHVCIHLKVLQQWLPLPCLCFCTYPLLLKHSYPKRWRLQCLFSVKKKRKGMRGIRSAASLILWPAGDPLHVRVSVSHPLQKGVTFLGTLGSAEEKLWRCVSTNSSPWSPGISSVSQQLSSGLSRISCRISSGSLVPASGAAENSTGSYVQIFWGLQSMFFIPVEVDRVFITPWL